jgi:hypothetical protein
VIDTRLEYIRARLATLNATRARKNTSREAEFMWLGAIDEVSDNAPIDIAYLLAELAAERTATVKWLADRGDVEMDQSLLLASAAIERGEHRKEQP